MDNKHSKEKILKENKNLNNVKKHNKNKYLKKSKFKKKFKNSQSFTNIKIVEDDGLIKLKTGEVASLIELKAIDLSLASRFEKTNFFNNLKFLYQIKDLNLKCYNYNEKNFLLKKRIVIRRKNINFRKNTL